MTHRWEFNVKYLNQGKDVTTLHSMQSRNIDKEYKWNSGS